MLRSFIHSSRPIVCLAFIAAVVAATAGLAVAEAPYQVAWTQQIGTSGSDNSRSVAVDAFGNSYITGRTYGSLTGTNAGSYDSFLTKFDSTGSELWTQQIGTSGADNSNSVAVDGSGNVYISGSTNGVLGDSSAGDWDAFLTKFDSSGSHLWSQQIGSSSTDVSYSVAVDGSGNAYISGYTEDVLGSSSAGSYDAFLSKFNSSGNELWTKQIGSSRVDKSFSVAVDGSGNAYISGHTYGDLAGANEGNEDAFLSKFDSSGNELWSQQFGTSDHDTGFSVAVDASGNAFVSGNTWGDLGGTNAGKNDAFLVKFDSLGELLWSQQIGTSERDFSYSVAVDGSGNAYITGQTSGDLGGINAGRNDPFVAKFDGLGNLLWSQQVGSAGDEWCYSIAVDAAGNAFISGVTTGDLSGTNAGGSDAFLVKFAVPEPATLSLLAIGGVAMLRRRRRK